MPERIDDGYPVVLRVGGRRVLVVGGGPVASRKAQALVARGARVVVVAPDVADDIAALPGVEVHRRPYDTADLEGARFVIVATDDPVTQQRVHDEAEGANVWVNAADDPDRCTVVLPAVARRGRVIVAVSTQGASPALASRLRDQLAAALPEDIEQVAETLAAERAAVHGAGISTETVDWSRRLDDLLAGGPTGHDPQGH